MDVPSTFLKCRDDTARTRKLAGEALDPVERELLLEIVSHYEELAMKLVARGSIGPGVIVVIQPFGIL